MTCVVETLIPIITQYGEKVKIRFFLPASFHAGCRHIKTQQAAPSLRHSMPGAGTRSVESPWRAMAFIAGSRLLIEPQQAAY